MKKTPRPVREHGLLCGLSAQGRQRRQLCRSASAALLGSLNFGLAGCGGGDESADLADEQRLPLGGVDSGGTGAKRAMFISAPIDATSPLTLNGTKFDTAGSTITDADGEVLPALSLLPGMTCQIEASGPRNGSDAPILRAQTVRVGEQLLGPVASVDPATSSFKALGQLVVLTPRTVLDAALAAGLAALRAGMVLQVWGQLDSAGSRIVATRVELAGPAEAFVVRGVLSSLDRSSGHVRIGDLQATALGGDAAVIAADAAVGTVVRARLSPAGHGASATLLALGGDALRLPDRVEAEVEGRVTRFASARRFAVDGIEVDAPAASWAQGAALIALGVRVAVHGRAVQGLLLATSVRVEPDEPVELEGTISAADPSRRSFVLEGITVTWSSRTVFEGGSARLLAARRRVAVLGRWSADRSRLEALHIHVEA